MYHCHNNYVNNEQTEIHQTPIMGLIVNNANNSLRVCLTVLKVVGFLTPPQTGIYSFFLSVYCFASFMFLVGGIIIAQTGAMFQIWGDLALMTSASFLLFTNLAFALKIINVVARRRQIQDIIDDADEVLVAEDREEGKEIIKSCNRETTRFLCMEVLLSLITVLGWAASAEKDQLPLRAWYPYDASKSPAYELTYFNQDLLTSDEEKIVQSRLRQCVIKHEAALKSTRLIQKCFSYPILAQFTVSAVIICVTAYQLAMELDNGNRVRSIPMATYLLCMMLQVYIYCYQGNQLTEESYEIAGAAYECPWYKCSLRLRRSLLIVMLRTRCAVQLTAGGFMTLSLSCFTSIIKASYTFFTVLKQVEDRNPK
ncbi:unnamed protein product [Spodoptera exigua]|nr:unnamed protein product [Spodoptera exigua]